LCKPLQTEERKPAVLQVFCKSLQAGATHRFRLKIMVSPVRIRVPPL
jgi:hypothetical protein